MNREQKIAWSFVITIPLGSVLGVIALLMHYYKAGSPIPPIVLAAAIIAVGPFLTLFIIKKDKGKVTSDERDKLIEKNAHLAGFGAVYLFIILASFVPLAIDPNAKIPTTWFPALLIGAGFFMVFARSLAILIQYGRTDKGEKS